MCFSARYDLRVELIIALVPTCSSEQLVDHSAWPVGQQDRRPVRTEPAGRTAPSAVKLRRYLFVIYNVDLLTLHNLIKIQQITKYTSYQGPITLGKGE